ncbi:MAG: hypothetical protein QOI48_2822 [Solirubrobacteraceae bacterium]|nr:hypothetical protein [Solirubrobacteraceae bacterium]
MQTQDCTAPSLAELRPMKPTSTPTFPVYHELVETLAATDAHPDATVAHVMATCAGYGYSDAATVAMIMARMGMVDNRCRMVAQVVDVMLISSTAFLIQSHDGRVVILCYRGTPPTSLITWLTDTDVNPEKIPISFPHSPGTFDVHGGVYRNVRSTRYAIVAALQRALDGESVLEEGGTKPDHPLESLYVTGHSLGASMAAMMGVMLTTERSYAPIAARLKAVYTFGQFMIGTPLLAEACNDVPFLRDNVIRYVYANDIAPQLPPTQSGPFEHFGQEYQYRTNGGEGQWHHNKTPRGQIKSLLEVVGNPLSFLARQFQITRNVTFHASVYDHLPHHYIAALTPPGVHSEYGE